MYLLILPYIYIYLCIYSCTYTIYVIIFSLTIFMKHYPIALFTLPFYYIFEIAFQSVRTIPFVTNSLINSPEVANVYEHLV